MQSKQLIQKLLKNKYPIWGYSPVGFKNISLAAKIAEIGGIGLINLEGLKQKDVENIISQIHQAMKNDNWGVRVANSEQLEWIEEYKIPIIIIPFELEQAKAQKLKEKQTLIVAEVLYFEEAKERTNWADLFLVKGLEAGGRVGEKTSFILMQEFSESGYPFVIQGGFGLFNISSAFVAGALAVVLEGQTYLFPECPLPQKAKDFLAKMGENDTYLMGESLDYKYRLAGKIANKTIRHLKKEEQEKLYNLEKKEFEEYLLTIAHHYETDWENEIVHAFLPLGVDIYFAKYIASRYNSLAEFFEGIMETVSNQLETIRADWPFDVRNSFAKKMGIKYPIVQGPMANITDKVDFAKKVAEKGAFPVFALGGLTKEETQELFNDIKEHYPSSLPYGCGIIGLEAVKKRRDAQLELMDMISPTIVLIAAGTVDLAKRVQQMGYETFLHTPALSMFAQALKEGLDNLILEGAECGGHIGTTSSMILWEAILEYLDEHRDEINKKINLIFAGGIGDGLSTALVASMIGLHLDLISPALQCGTGYLFTEEIVETKALSPVYQEFLLNSKETKTIGATVNTRARAVPSPFVIETLQKELERVKAKIPIQERKHLYEKDNLGALRIASRAEIWNNEHVPGSKETTQYLPIEESIQRKRGCFMAGEIISRKRYVYTLEEFHEELTTVGREVFQEASKNWEYKTLKEQQEEIIEKIDEPPTIEIGNKIAIVGMGCVLPDALNIEEFWKNILSKKYSITEVPKERWDPEIYYDDDPKTPDRTYSKIGAFVKGFKFNSIKFRIPPRIAEQMDDTQKWALEAARQALEDANIPTDGKKRLPIAVIVGNSLGGEKQRETNKRIHYAEFIKSLEGSPEFKQLNQEEQKAILKSLEENYLAKIPPITEDTMPGELSNIIAGRIANVFNLTGKTMTTDAACASSLAAVDTAVKGLIAGDFDIVLAGGADKSMDPTTYIKFSKIGALSSTGSRPFDAEADGFVMGEGAGFVVLKRLEDAIRDNDRIYAVISAVGSSSDGKGKGITAPNPLGQEDAIQRAIQAAEVSLDDIDYIEAHGTSTRVGDSTEIKVLEKIFNKRKNKDKVAVASIKSQIGHLKSAAGIASLLKTTLALYHKVLPPSANVQKLNPLIDWNKSKLYINTEPRKWEKNSNKLRRAGVSAFGFGGTNYHAILEEYNPAFKYVKIKQPVDAVATTGVEQTLPSNQVCFMFSGQGSQYLGMIKELYESSTVVKETLDEAEVICAKYGNFSVKEIIFGSPALSEAENTKRLQQTQYTQPAIYVVEMALYRYLHKAGIKPSYVTGHSLGEYAALVAAGVLTFEDGLKAVIERGKAMQQAGEITKGAMAAVFASGEEVKSIVKQVREGYVTVANYNSPKQTVISGEEQAVDKAIELAEQQGYSATKLRVSTAFHSKIVEPAKKHMAAVLEKMVFYKPKIRVYANVTAKAYPTDPTEIKKILVDQIDSSVQWVQEMLNVYQDGGRIFIEVGPKKALYKFAQAILQDKEIEAFLTLLPSKDEKALIEDTIRKVKEKIASATPQRAEKIVKKIVRVTEDSPYGVLESDKELKELARKPYFEEYLRENIPILKPLMLNGYELYEKKYRKSIEIAEKVKKLNMFVGNIGITGVGIGIPGKSSKVFDDANFEKIFAGKILIEEISDEIKAEMVKKNIIQLVKSPDGNASFVHINDISKVVQLAAQLGEFSPNKDFGISEKLLKALDTSFQLAICGGLEALKDAGIPLVKSKIKTSTGKILEGDWVLPAEIQNETGIVFASAFPGYESLIKEMTDYFTWAFNKQNAEKFEQLFNNLISEVQDSDFKTFLEDWYTKAKDEFIDVTEEEQYQFSRQFLFKVLSMGHSQFAQLIKAKGPNTSINAACASTTQAIGIAEDWIRMGRCKRVIVIAGENGAGEVLLPWLGSGFLVAGGVTTEKEIEKAVLPFGKGRNGLVIGSAAAGLVVESEEAYNERGVKPIVDVIGTFFANSAYHGSRLNVEDIAERLDQFISSVERRHGISRKEIAEKGIFVSHETYTPARGGSSEAEIESIKKVFREYANKIAIINTKGYTGHPMGAGIEECIAIKAMEKGKLPPIVNIDKLDPKFEGFNFVKETLNERKQYALRLAAGFGSQLAFALFRLNSYEGRFSSPLYAEWLAKIGGNKESVFMEGRVLKMHTVEQRATATAITQPKPVTTQASLITQTLISIVSELTGYEPAMIDAKMDLEEDLGIDTIKQAEIFGKVREKYNLPDDESVSLAEFRTIESIAEYVSKVVDITEQPQSSPKISSSTIVQDLNTDVITDLTEIVSELTGYEPTMIDAKMDLEEDLGIDTIKQAEIFGKVREKYNLPDDESVSLAEFRTIESIAEYVQSILGATSGTTLTQETVDTETLETENNKHEIEEKVVRIIADITGYEPEMIDNQMDLEEDLGIDTIKQAEIFGKVRDAFHLPSDEEINIAEFRTIADIAEFVGKYATQPTGKIDTAKLKVETHKSTTFSAKKIVPLAFPLSTKGNKLDEIENILLLRLAKSKDNTLLEELQNAGKTVEELNINNNNAQAARDKYDLIIILAEEQDDYNAIEAFEWIFNTLQQVNIDGNTKIVSVLKTTKNFEITSVFGGIVSFAKSLTAEISCKTKAIVTPDIKIVLEEINRWDDLREVYYVGNKRYTLTEQETGQLSESLNVCRDDLLVATGGARGITFECLKDLVERKEVDIALIGRSEISEEIKELAKKPESELQEEKSKFISQLKQEHERITPVEAERRWQKKLNAIETLRNIGELNKRGINAKYYACDVTDTVKMAQILKQIEEDFGKKITLIVHGAGIEESKQFKKKHLAKSRKIVEVKVKGIENILSSIDTNSLKRVICFSSVAGRYGNRGQVDYAYANGFLAALCNNLSKRGISSLAISWTAWEGVGMATQGNITKLLKAAGVELLPLKTGVELFTHLFTSNIEGEVVVAGKLGLLAPKLPETKDQVDKTQFPLLNKITIQDQKIDNYRILSRTEDLYLNDHQIASVPIFPAVMGIELFAEMFAYAHGIRPNVFTNTAFNVALKVRDNEKQTMTTYDILSKRFVLASVSKNGKVNEHFSTEANIEVLHDKTVSVPIVKAVPLLRAEEIYKLFFHGASFQVLKALLAITNENVTTELHIPNLPLFGTETYQTTIDSLGLEACLQTAALHALVKFNIFALPSKISKLLIYKTSKPKYALATFVKRDETHVYYNVKLIGEKGALLAEFKELGLIETRISVKIPEEVKEDMKTVREYLNIEEALPEEKKNKSAIIPISQVKETVAKEPETLRNYLKSTEKSRMAKISNEKRKTEYLSGIIAAKTLYAYHRKDENALKEVEVRKTRKGQPYLYLPKKKKNDENYISISHSGNFAVAAIDTKPIGVDIEQISSHSEAFYNEAFRDEEKLRLAKSDKKATTYWTIKESVAKALGEGLNLSLKDITVIEQEGAYKVKLSEKIKDELNVDDSKLKIEAYEANNYVITFCKLE